MNRIKALLINPVEFEQGSHLPSEGKYYFAQSDAVGHVVIPEGVHPGDSITISYTVPEHALKRVPSLEPKRLPRNQRIPHLKRGGYRR